MSLCASLLVVVLAQLPEPLVCGGGEQALAKLCALPGFHLISWSDKDWLALNRFAKRNSGDEADDLALIYLAALDRFFPGLEKALAREQRRLADKTPPRRKALGQLMLKASMAVLERGGGQFSVAPPPLFLLELIDQLSDEEGMRRHALMTAAWVLIQTEKPIPEAVYRRLVESSERGDGLAICASYARGTAYEKAGRLRDALEMYQQAGRGKFEPLGPNWLDCRGIAEGRLRDVEAKVRREN